MKLLQLKKKRDSMSITKAASFIWTWHEKKKKKEKKELLKLRKVSESKLKEEYEKI